MHEGFADTSYSEKLGEKGQQQAKLENVLRPYGYNVELMTYICGYNSSLFKRKDSTMRLLRVECAAARKLKSKIHEHSITCADNRMKCRRQLERAGLQNSRAKPP